MNPVEKKCCEYAESFGFLSHKMGVNVRVGWPDRMFIGLHNTFLFVEFKRPGEALRPAQKRMIKKFADRDIPVFVVEELEHFKSLITVASNHHENE